MRARRQTQPRELERRSGAIIVETALILPIFGMFMAGMMEFGHIYLVIGTMGTAATSGARIGAVDDMTTADVTAEVDRILGSAVNLSGASRVIYVKDASVFDQPGMDPSNVDFANLPNVEVKDLTTGQLFIVRLEVQYDSVALLPPFWAKGINLTSQSVMRHE